MALVAGISSLASVVLPTCLGPRIPVAGKILRYSFNKGNIVLLILIYHEK
jgi:hypothetical protein